MYYPENFPRKWRGRIPWSGCGLMVTRNLILPYRACGLVIRFMRVYVQMVECHLELREHVELKK